MNDFNNRITELYNRSLSRNIFTFSDFLSPTEQAELVFLKQKDYELFGGASFCERKMAKFGNKEELGYDQDYPFIIIRIEAKGISGDIAQLTHRDYLGAIMNLGIERAKVGDIFVGQKEAYAVVSQKPAELILNQLTKVRHAAVNLQIVQEIPDDYAPKKESKSVVVQTNRVDAFVCRVFNLSRENGSQLFEGGRVFINGKQIDKGGKELSEGDVVSVRGYGKFVFISLGGETRKGKTFALVEVYV